MRKMAILLVIFSIVQIFGNIVVVSSNQDKDIALPLSKHLNASLIIIPWGTIDEKYLNEIKSKNPDKVIIIGGRVSVPKFYEYGNFSRYAGKNRLETALIVLKKFYGISTRDEIIYYPSKNKILKYINESKNWEIYSGKSNISIRWSYLIKNELKYDKNGNRVNVYIGNVNNNPKLKKNWVKNLPKIVSFCPSVILNGNNLYILGGDNCLPITVRSLFKSKNWDYIEVFKFLVILFILTILFYKFIRSPYYLITLLIISQYIYSNLDKFTICWDALFVYLDGALSLHYLGHYETILGNRGFVGLSYLLNLWFYLFKVSFESVYLYQIMMLFLLISGIFIYFRNKVLSVLTVMTLLSISIFTKYIFIFSTELTYLTIMLWILLLIDLLESKHILIYLYDNIKKYLSSINIKETHIKFLGILLISILTVILSSIKMIGIIIPFTYFIVRRNSFGLVYLVLTLILEGLLIYLVLGNDINGYLNEVSAKGGVSYNLIINNINFYIKYIIKYSIVPISLLIFFNKKLNINYILILAILNLIMPLFWVATDSRYLLPYFLLITIYAFKIYDK